MCGITGIFSVNGLGQYYSALQAANDMVKYRGPDGAGFALFNTRSQNGRIIPRTESLPDNDAIGDMTLALGHRRLAIIDLSDAGLQPMSNNDESVWITFNGEIYNYLELRSELQSTGYRFRSQSDTEVILAAYDAWGENCVSRFNGMWAFAIADLKRQKLFCSRDRFGIKPFHYYSNGEQFVFSSEIKQLLCFPFVPKQVNKRTVYEFLAYGAVDNSQETFFVEIYNLLPGHNLTLDLRDRSLTTTKYYKPYFEINTQITFAQAAREFRHLLTDSVRLRLRSDVEVGSCLSGGLDSSSIVCIVHQLLTAQGKNDFQRTFSCHFEAKEANELEYMQEVIRAVGVQAHFTYPTPEELLSDLERLVWHHEEPFGSSSIFAQWSVFKLVHQQGVKVMLDGQGADEQLAGYIGFAPYFFNELQAKQQYLRLAWEVWRHAQVYGKPLLTLVPSPLGDSLRRFFRFQDKNSPSLLVDWIDPDLVEQYQQQSYYLANLQVKPLGDLEHLNNILYQLTFLNNIQQLVKYEDRNSMAFSVEARVPFLDYRLVEFLFSLPSHFKIGNGYTKRVLRKGMSGLLPETIRWRIGKLGFSTPERTWQSTILRPLIEEAIRDRELRSFIIPDKAMVYFEGIEKYNIVNFVPWRWLNLYLWMKNYDLTY